MYEKFTLGHDKAREVHNSIINIDSGYSLTLPSIPDLTVCQLMNNTESFPKS